MAERTFEITRELVVHAPRELVFRYFTDPERLAQWMGGSSRIGRSPGEPVDVVGPDGARATGQVLEAREPSLLRFTWIGPDESMTESVVEIRLDVAPAGTLLRLRHVLPVGVPVDESEAVWACHLARLAARTSHERLDAAVARALDAWYMGWNADVETDRVVALGRACTADLVYRDDSVVAEDRDALTRHVARCRGVSPGITLAPDGDPLLLGDLLTADQAFVTPDGTAVGELRLVARVADDGRLRRVDVLFATPIPGVTPGARLGAGRTVSMPIESGPAVPAHAEPRREPIEPHFWVSDPAAAVAFYTDALGFRVVSRFPADEPTWFQLGRDAVRLMVARRPDPDRATGTQAYLREAAARTGTPGAVSLYLGVDDVDAVLAACERAGAELVEPVWEPFWGGRQFTVAAPEGHWWTVCGPRKGGETTT